MKTQEELVHQALRNLGTLPQGGNTYPSVDARVQPMVDMLAERGIMPLVDPANMPDAIFLPLADILADLTKAEYDKPMDTQLTALRVKAEMDLRLMFANGPTYAPLKVEYF